MLADIHSGFAGLEPEFVLLMSLPILVSAVGLWAYWREQDQAARSSAPRPARRASATH